MKIMNRRASMDKWYADLGPKVCEILEVNAFQSSQFLAHWGGAHDYAINKGIIGVAKVDLRRKTCTCRRFNFTGIPRMHAIAVIYNINEDPARYVDNWYLKNSFEKSYWDVIYGIRMERYWTKTGIPSLSPHPVLKQHSWPRKLRIKEVGETPNKARRFARLKK